jgi:hypothetical protein
MTDHVARAIEREFSQHLDTCDLYDLKSRVEAMLRPFREKVSAKRFAVAPDADFLTEQEMKKIGAYKIGPKRRFKMENDA